MKKSACFKSYVAEHGSKYLSCPVLYYMNIVFFESNMHKTINQN